LIGASCFIKLTGVDAESRRKHAQELIEQGYHEQLNGDVDAAIRLYQASLACFPTAEAHAYLGWGLSFLGKLDEAIEECKKAIAIDPEYGNPYNDIGSYLIHQGKHDEAMPWLEQALNAKRYEPRHYPHCNLGRVYVARGMLRKAIEEFEAALAIEPTYDYAREALEETQAKLN
jgi:tetratricopeptide (TPR) repeat protein